MIMIWVLLNWCTIAFKRIHLNLSFNHIFFMKISKFHKVVRFQVCDPYFRSSFSLHLCAYKCNLPSQSRRKVSKYGGFFLEGGALCVEIGFYADISYESRCNRKIKVWAHFYKILVCITRRIIC